MNYPDEILMVRPHGFRLAYSINPHMDLSVPVDTQLAMKQWHNLKETYEQIGLKVKVIEGSEQFPDMVFCANPIFWHPNGVIYSRMRFPERTGEIEIYDKCFEVKNTYHMEAYFEGAGDLIWNYDKDMLFGGIGPRTEKQAYEELKPLLDYEIVPLNLISETYYHLDTCLSILNGHTAVYVPEAFEQSARDRLAAQFDQLIEVDKTEASRFLAANCHGPDGRNVLVEQGARQLQNSLSEKGFRVFPIDTSEFLKAGGSIFCMKHQGQFMLR